MIERRAVRRRDREQLVRARIDGDERAAVCAEGGDRGALCVRIEREVDRACGAELPHVRRDECVDERLKFARAGGERL